MRWHASSVDEVMRHPAHSLAWKHLDHTYPDFAQETRNIRLGLSTDGFQPFGQSGKQYTYWPVIVTPYNLPSWLWHEGSLYVSHCDSAWTTKSKRND